MTTSAASADEPILFVVDGDLLRETIGRRSAWFSR